MNFKKQPQPYSHHFSKGLIALFFFQHFQSANFFSITITHFSPPSLRPPTHIRKEFNSTCLNQILYTGGRKYIEINQTQPHQSTHPHSHHKNIAEEKEKLYQRKKDLLLS